MSISEIIFARKVMLQDYFTPFASLALMAAIIGKNWLITYFSKYADAERFTGRYFYVSLHIQDDDYTIVMPPVVKYSINTSLSVDTLSSLTFDAPGRHKHKILDVGRRCKRRRHLAPRKDIALIRPDE